MTVNLEENAPMNATTGWEGILAGSNLHRLENQDLPKFLVRQRWFATKSQSIQSTRLLDWAMLGRPQSVLCLIEVRFEEGWTDSYLLPLAMAFGAAGEQLRGRTPNAIVAPVTSDKLSGLLYDGVVDDLSCRALFSLIENGSELPGHEGRILGVRGGAFQAVLGPAPLPLPVRPGSAEQSNTSILYGDRFILKLYRRPEVGENPDCEIGKYLTEETNFDRIPPFAGMLRYLSKDGTEARTLAMLQGLVKNHGDGWEWSLRELDRYYERARITTLPDETSRELKSGLELLDRPPSPLEREYVGPYLDSAAILGRRTAQLHLALAAGTADAQFRPEPFTGLELRNLLVGIHDHGATVFRLLEGQIASLPPEVQRLAASVLGQRQHILANFLSPESDGWHGQRIRIHGDYHLGQVLRTEDDFVILDFEGEPARPLAERRQKQCPLKDVAGMLRSFSYAAYVALFNFCELHSHSSSQLAPWAQLWERSAVRAFLHSYRQTAADVAFLPRTSSEFRKLLNIFVLDKALYEVRYELNSRPPWVRIPLLGILSLTT
jgi:maltose alpha-D-glucosyltransferase/alpha-amylase